MSAPMKSTVTLPYLKWRDGRPRWEPNARLMAEGWKGQDLRGPDGAWMAFEAARGWVAARMEEVAARRAALGAAAAAGRRRPPRRAGAGALTLDRLVTLWCDAIETRLAAETRAGVALTLAPKTVRDYALKARWLVARLPRLDAALGRRRGEAIWADVADAPAAALTPPLGRRLYQDLRLAHGDHMAAAVMRVASIMFGWAIAERGLTPVAGHPFRQMRMATPPERARAATPAEITALVAAADALAMPEIGDCILLGVWTGQRQADRLALQETAFAGNGGRIVFRQGKTGARVAVPPSAGLLARLDAARQRRRAALVTSLHVVVDAALGGPPSADRYRKRFAMVRDAAVAGLPAQGLAAMPSLDGFRDQDLRDTAVTWLALAGCTTEEIRAITGHERDTILKILKHYIADHDGFAGAAIDKLEAWYARETG